MENRNGQGIFYGVIGVATLVVAIIGATFAYFSVTANGATQNGVTAQSANVAGTLTITDTLGTATNMIPVTKANMLTSYGQSGSGNKAKCKGVSQADATQTFDLCNTYDFTISNSANIAQTVNISLKTVSNNFANLYYCVYGSAGTTTPVVDCKAVPTGSEAITTVNIGAGSSESYTVVLYVNETNGDQTALDSGKNYVGTVEATTDSGSSHVTGVIAS